MFNCPSCHAVLDVQAMKKPLLTESRLQMIQLLGKGLTIPQIAIEMDLKIHTVTAGLQRIYRQCGIKSRYQLAQIMEAGELSKYFNLPRPKKEPNPKLFMPLQQQPAQTPTQTSVQSPNQSTKAFNPYGVL